MTITAKIIKDSINPWGKRITTFELEYPRMIHSEFMTHREFSRNGASSRAIPITKVIEQVNTNPAMPFKWGKNQSGMQASENLTESEQEMAEDIWLAARTEAVRYATLMMKLGAHKQVVNRLLEPFQHMKIVLTTTEYENWKWLRLHKDADPTIYELARVIAVSRDESTPVQLQEGMWHTPYVQNTIINGEQLFYDENGNKISLEQAIKISCSSCAQVSYRKLDTSLEKAEDIYDKLVCSEPVHASAFEHVAKVWASGDNVCGITGILVHYHEDMQSDEDVANTFMSGNFRGGWIQYRQLIPNNAKH